MGRSDSCSAATCMGDAMTKIQDSEIEQAIKEHHDREEKFRIAVWSIVLICIGLAVAVALR